MQRLSLCLWPNPAKHLCLCLTFSTWVVLLISIGTTHMHQCFVELGAYISTDKREGKYVSVYLWSQQEHQHNKNIINKSHKRVENSSKIQINKRNRRETTSCAFPHRLSFCGMDRRCRAWPNAGGKKQPQTSASKQYEYWTRGPWVIVLSSLWGWKGYIRHSLPANGTWHLFKWKSVWNFF